MRQTPIPVDNDTQGRSARLRAMPPTDTVSADRRRRTLETEARSLSRRYSQADDRAVVGPLLSSPSVDTAAKLGVEAEGEFIGERP